MESAALGLANFVIYHALLHLYEMQAPLPRLCVFVLLHRELSKSGNSGDTTAAFFDERVVSPHSCIQPAPSAWAVMGLLLIRMCSQC